MANQSSELSQISDKKHAPGAAAPQKFEYQPSHGDYRESQAKMAAMLEESNTFTFQGLKLPGNKELLTAIQDMSKAMGDQEKGAAVMPDGSTIVLAKVGGQLKGAVVMRADGSTDIAQFDAKMNTVAEVVQTALGTRERDFRPDGTLAVESNTSGSYKDKIEFDATGKKIMHLHSETPIDVKDDKRNTDGSGVFIQTHKDCDPKEAYTVTATSKADGSVIEDRKFRNGEYIHAEADAKGQLNRLDKSNLAKGYIEHNVRQPDGEVKSTRDFLT